MTLNPSDFLSMSISKVQCLSLHRKCSSTDLSVDEKLTEKELNKIFMSNRKKSLVNHSGPLAIVLGQAFGVVLGLCCFLFLIWRNDDER